MAKSDNGNGKTEKNKHSRWVITIFFVTFLISATISWASDEIMSVSSVAVAFVILLVIVFIGIVFDILGMAVASALETPFHSMASRKVPGAQESILLLRNAERVSSICNDVIGDICGVVSGSASATIAAQVLSNLEFSLAMSASVAALTVGGKAVGKSFAINCCTEIVYTAGKIIYFFRHLGDLFKKKGKKNKA